MGIDGGSENLAELTLQLCALFDRTRRNFKEKNLRSLGVNCRPQISLSFVVVEVEKKPGGRNQARKKYLCHCRALGEPLIVSALHFEII